MIPKSGLLRSTPVGHFRLGRIASYKIFEHVCFVVEFPATLYGKIQKYKMREFEIEARGVQAVAKVATAQSAAPAGKV
jgi:acyl-coenzyme A synthetase/AMP-(fatty) acid ligase